MISAALLAVPGASAYFLGGAVVYTRAARQRPARHFRRGDGRDAPFDRSLCAARRRAPRAERFATTWALGETGAAGPTGNRYGDASGHSCIAIAGAAERAITIETGSADRFANMAAFTAAALDLLMQATGRRRQQACHSGERASASPESSVVRRSLAVPAVGRPRNDGEGAYSSASVAVSVA